MYVSINREISSNRRNSCCTVYIILEVRDNINGYQV